MGTQDQDRNSLCDSMLSRGALDREKQDRVSLRARGHPCPPGVDLWGECSEQEVATKGRTLARQRSKGTESHKVKMVPGLQRVQELSLEQWLCHRLHDACQQGSPRPTLCGRGCRGSLVALSVHFHSWVSSWGEPHLYEAWQGSGQLKSLGKSIAVSHVDRTRPLLCFTAFRPTEP